MPAQRTVLLWRCEGRCRALSTGTAHPLVFDHLAAFHDKRDVFQDAHVGERVGRHRHQIGIKARLELPDPIRPAQQLAVPRHQQHPAARVAPDPRTCPIGQARPQPLQRGVRPGVIAAQRAAIVRGKVLDATGRPLPGVRVTVPQACTIQSPFVFTRQS